MLARDGQVEVIDLLARDGQVEVIDSLARDGQVEVIDSLARGDWVVTRGHAALLDGSLVEPRLPGGEPFPGTGALAHVSDGEAATP